FASNCGGDALDLVAQTRCGGDLGKAVRWARDWLGVDNQKQSAAPPRSSNSSSDPHHWTKFWKPPKPIAGTFAQAYLAGRGLRFADPAGEMLRFTSDRARKNPVDEFEHHPAMLVLLRDIHTDEPCGIINVYLRADGSDRIRDKKGKTVTGRAKNAA